MKGTVFQGRQRAFGRGRAPGFGIPLVLVMPLMLVGGCAPARGYEAALVLADIAAGQGDSRLKRVTPPPGREEVTYEASGRLYEADLYRPGEAARSGVVLVPGAVRGGQRDSRLVAFAETLARARFVVMVPDLTSLHSLQLRPEDIVEVRDAFAYLAARQDLGYHDRMGMIGLSYAAGPVILAALDPAISNRVDFILSVGGYYDLQGVLTSFITGYYGDRGRWQWQGRNPYGVWLFVLSNVDRLSDPHDRRVLRAMAERRLDDAQADLSDLVGGLGPQGRAVYAFVSNSEPELVPQLLAALPESVRNDMAALDLSNKDMSALRSRLLLVHGRYDPMIPRQESLSLAGAVPPGRARLFVTDALAHVEVKPGLGDYWNLWRAVYALLSERDGV